MADLFADALMLLIKIVMVAAYLFGVYYIRLFINGLFEKIYDKIHDKARERGKKEVNSDDV